MSPPAPFDPSGPPPLCIVINAGSGRGDQQQRIDTLKRVFDDAGRAHRFFMIERSAQISEIARQAVAQACADDGIVVAAGGDGTLNAVAQAVLGSGRPFGVIPQGTFNYFGRANGIPQDTEAAARALLRATPQPVQVGRVNGQVFLVNASLGLYPQLLEDREAYKQQLGRSRFVALISGLATLLRERRQLRLDIETGGRTYSLRTPTLFVGNNRLQFERIGLDQPAEALDHGKLAGVVVKPIGTLAMLGLALRGALGRLGDAEHLQSFAVRRLTVRPRDHRLVKLAADGEIHWLRSPLVFEPSPEPLLLMMPAEDDRVAVE